MTSSVLGELAAATEQNRRDPDPELERRLVSLRAKAWPEVEAGGRSGTWPSDVPDLFGEQIVPEVERSDLTPLHIRSALEHRGALVVRDFVPPDAARALKDSMDEAWDQIDGFMADPDQPASEWFDPSFGEENGLSPFGRGAILQSGTSYVAESPRLLFRLTEALVDAGFDRLIDEYFGEPAAVSLLKLAHRRLPPEAKGGWHQDAAFYGTKARILNLWLPVTPCGADAPGIEFVPRRLEDLVETYDPDRDGGFDFVATNNAVDEQASETPTVRPVFDAGDALFFDQFLLHQTAASDEYRSQRYGFECWFFAASTFPEPERWTAMAF